MTVSRIRQLEHFKNDETIKEGLYFCPECEVIISSYYLRTFSINCMRTQDFGKCNSCDKFEEKKLLENELCPKCKKRISNTWQKICGEKLILMSLDKFRKFCFEAIMLSGKKIDIEDYEIEVLYFDLSSTDFVSRGFLGEAGLNYRSILNEIKRAQNFKTKSIKSSNRY